MSIKREDVNRINYNTYFINQNLNTFIRKKMQSESLFTPLSNTPNCFEDGPAAKMKLLGNRGHQFPVQYEGPDDPSFNNRMDKMEPYESRFQDLRYGTPKNLYQVPVNNQENIDGLVTKEKESDKKLIETYEKMKI